MRKMLLIAVVPFIVAGTSPSGQDDPYRAAKEYYRSCEFRKALPYYKELADQYRDDAEFQYRAGICLIHSDKKTASIPYFEKTIKLDKEKQFFDAPFFLGVGYHLQGQFTKAISQFQLYKKALDPAYPVDQEEIAEAERRIRICKNAIVLVKDSLPVQVNKMNAPVNSSYGEVAPVISADGKNLYFSSNRNGGIGGLHPLTGGYNEDIYVAERHHDGSYSIGNVGEPINTPEHEAPMALTADGSVLFFYRSSNGFTSDILYCKKTPQGWSEEYSAGPYINARDFKTGGCISKDGKRLYFSSDRPGGFGGMDLYYSDLQKEGFWGPPVNLGKQINTSYNEESPFLHNERLYFTSEGHTTMGGFDIFYSVLRNGVWGNTVNAGYPINSLDDDLYISFTADGQTAYISRISSSNYGMEDLYILNMESSSKPDEKQALKETDKVELIEEKEDHEPMGNSSESSVDIIEVDANGELNLRVHFPFNEGNKITDYSRKKLDKVVEYLQANQKVVLELRGYSDKTGTEDYNNILSYQRAETVRSYLLQKGISSERLLVKGCGTAGCKEVTGIRENVINRRVEFYVSL